MFFWYTTSPLLVYHFQLLKFKTTDTTAETFRQGRKFWPGAGRNKDSLSRSEEQAGRQRTAGAFCCEFARGSEARGRHSGAVAIPSFCSVRLEGFCSTDRCSDQRSSGQLPKEAEGHKEGRRGPACSRGTPETPSEICCVREKVAGFLDKGFSPWATCSCRWGFCRLTAKFGCVT